MIPSVPQVQSVEAAPPLDAQTLARMSFEDLIEVALVCFDPCDDVTPANHALQEHRIDDRHLSGMNQKAMHDLLFSYL